jgi:CRISPR-associated endonuclease/helicase Cas3
MSQKEMVLSHPEKTLSEHICGLKNIAEKILQRKNFTSKLAEPEKLQFILKKIIEYHDLGKATDYFQYKLIKRIIDDNITTKSNFRNYIDSFREAKYANIEKVKHKTQLFHHAKLGSYAILEHFSSEDEILRLIILSTIKYHHGALKNFESENFIISNEDKDTLIEQLHSLNKNYFSSNYSELSDEKIKSILEKFSEKRQLNSILRTLEENPDYHYYFLQLFLFSLLLSSDKGDVMLKNNDKIKSLEKIPSDIVDNFKNTHIKNNKKIDQLRAEAYQLILNNLSQSKGAFYSITLPTGLGKTFSAYKVALKLQNNHVKNPPRIIYCLPFTSIIDQNASLFQKILEFNNIDKDTISIHHYLSRISEQSEEYSDAEYLVEGWEKEIVITTFVQLLESIFTNKNKDLRKFHNLVNSIIILDEIQNIPPKYIEAIEKVFLYLNQYFNTKFLFVTATQPIILNKETIELTDPSRKKTQEIFASLNRIKIDKSLLKLKEIEKTKLIESITGDYKQSKSILVIINTVKQAQQIYKEVKNHFSAIESALLTSSILPIHRKEIIKKIQNNIHNDIQQIVISTQVVEAGVDIDFDIVYRDFAPIDSINQAAGRCNRNGIKGKGIVKLFNAGKANLIYDSSLLDITENILDEYPDIIEEKQFYKINTSFFKKTKKAIQDYNNHSQDLIKYIKTLQFEKVEESFKLIEQKDYNYNVFLPIDQAAEKIWEAYTEIFSIEDDFEMKKQLKMLMPSLLQYVTKFPKNYYIPDEDRNIIRENNWQEYYNTEYGFLFNDNDCNYSIVL